MSVKASPATAAQRWNQGFAASGTKYEEGVNAVTVAPGQLAAAQSDVWLQRLNESKALFAANVAKVDLPTWKNKTITTGKARLATGAAKGEPKVAAFMQNFLPKLSNIVDGLGPRGDFATNMARFQKYAEALHQQKGQF